jgi:hypothetical protein
MQPKAARPSVCKSSTPPERSISRATAIQESNAPATRFRAQRAANKLEYEVAPQSSADLSRAPRRRQSPARRWLWRRVAIDLQLRAA